MKSWTFLLAVLLAGLSGSPCFAQGKSVAGAPDYLNKAPLDRELKQLGDFSLSDDKGSLFLLGRMVVDFTSIYLTITTEGAEARGECPFMVAEVKDGVTGKTNLHSMRYFIRDGKSVAYLYSNIAKSEIAVEFDFVPGKDFAEGSIRVYETTGPKLVGLFKMRIREAATK